MPATSATLPCDVLIVGAGIAGSALACALRHRGLEIVQLEASTRPLDTARGDHLQCAVVEILEGWGALPALFAAGAEKRHVARYVTERGATILEVDYSRLDIPHPYYLYLHHELLAQTFLGLASGAPGYRLFRGARARDFEIAGGGVRALEVTLPGDCAVPEGFAPGQRLRIEPHLVIGADGRSSRVREVLGFTAVEHDYQSPIVLQLAPRRASERDPRNPLTVFVGPRGSISRIPRAFDGWKIGTTVSKAEVGFWKSATRAQRQAAVAALAPELESLELEPARFYPVKLLNTHRWVSGNTVLVGDACHAMHAARGQGMNVAIRCLAALVERLPEASGVRAPAVIAAALAAYESATKPAVEPILAENHALGAARDHQESERGARLIAQLDRIQNDPARLAAYTLGAAGYSAPSA